MRPEGAVRYQPPCPCPDCAPMNRREALVLASFLIAAVAIFANLSDTQLAALASGQAKPEDFAHTLPIQAEPL